MGAVCEEYRKTKMQVKIEFSTPILKIYKQKIERLMNVSIKFVLHP